MPSSLALAAVCAVSFCAATPRAASPPPASELEIYIDAVVAHQPGLFKAGEDAVQKLTDADVEVLASALTRLATVFERRRAAGEPPPTGADEVFLARRDYRLSDLASRMRFPPDRPNEMRPFLRRAALFHLDSMVAYARQPAGEWVVRHERVGRTVANVLGSVYGEKGFVADWWSAVIGALTEPMPQAAALAATDAVRAVPDAARIAFAAGAAYEVLAFPRFQEAAAAWDSGSRSGLDVPADLRRAADLFRSAAVRDDHDAETHLRLGRVSCLLGDAAAAREQLERARQEGAADPFVAYHAAMFLGDVDERSGRLEAAETEYRRALVEAPAAQAPRVALSHLRHLAGERQAALAQITSYMFAARPLGQDQDPWFAYGLGAGRRLRATFGRLLEELDR